MKPTLLNIYPESKVLECPECGGNMVLRKSTKFPKPFYGCTKFPYCSSTHGAHPDGSPLGVPANAETKQWRIKAHEALDKIWGSGDKKLTEQQKRYRRNITYSWLASRLRMKQNKEKCHIAMFDIHRCMEVIAICEQVTWSNIEQWRQTQKIYSKPLRKSGREKMPRYY